MDALIKLENIEFGYSEQIKIFNKLNFKLLKGEKLGIVGDNGSGKTTLCHIIMGLIKPDNGKVFLFGKEMKTEEDFKDKRVKIGFLFQDSDDQLFLPTVIDDVAFGPLNLGFKKEEAKNLAEITLKNLNIFHLKDRATYKLSGGEKRMVALATILAMNPEVLILDEPTNAIDNTHYNILVDFLKNTSITFIVISHNKEFLASVVKRKKILKNGIIQNLI